MRTLLSYEKYMVDFPADHCGAVLGGDSFEDATDLYDAGYFKVNYASLQPAIRDSYYTRIASLLPKEKIVNVLDVGVGSGYFLRALDIAGFKCQGVDASRHACELAKATSGINVFHIDPNSESIENVFGNSFDAITILDVLAHVENPISMIRNVSKILRSDGILLLKTPNHPPEFYEYIAEMFHENDVMRKVLAHIPYQRHGWGKSTLMDFLGDMGFIDMQIEETDDIKNEGVFLWSDMAHPCRMIYKRKLRRLFKRFPKPSLIAIGRKP